MRNNRSDDFWKISKISHNVKKLAFSRAFILDRFVCWREYVRYIFFESKYESFHTKDFPKEKWMK